MSRPDALGLDRIERDLPAALAWEPSPAALRHMDARVARVVIPRPQAHRGWGWPRRQMLLLAATSLLLVGAASGLTLLQQAVDLDPRWKAAFDLAERPNLSQTIGDYTVTLERAYADPNELVLAISLAGPSNSFAAAPVADVTDARGRQYLAITEANYGDSASGGSGSIHAYQVPPGVSGPLRLTVIVEPLKSEPVTDLSSPPAWFSSDPSERPMEEPGLVGPWVFHLSLPLRAAVTVTPAQRVEVARVPITLQSIRITRTSIRVSLATDLAAVRSEKFRKWTIEGFIRQGNHPEQSLGWTPISADWTGQPIGPRVLSILQAAESGAVIVKQTDSGNDSPSGAWTLVIRRLAGSSSCVSGSPWLPCDDPGPTKTVEGPWTFRFNVP
jgi:hypothetical protein